MTHVHADLRRGHIAVQPEQGGRLVFTDLGNGTTSAWVYGGAAILTPADAHDLAAALVDWADLRTEVPA